MSNIAYVRLVHITTVPSSLEFISGQIGYLKDRGFEVYAISSPGEALDEFGKREGIRVFGVRMERRITPMKDMIALIELVRKIREISPDIVVSHTPKAGLLGMIGACLAGVPARVYYMRGLPFTTKKGLRRSILRFTERISSLLAHRVLCVSHSVRRIAIEEGICSPSKSLVILNGSGNGVDATGKFSRKIVGEKQRMAARRASGIPAEDLVVGYVGRIARDKGLSELAEAWNGIKERFPKAHLLIVGPFDECDPLPISVESKLRAGPQVHLVGYTSDVARFYAAMDIFVLPSYREGFANCLLEAAAMELPIVATAVPGCIDFVDDGITGTLVPPKDPRALRETVLSYLFDPDLRRRHGKAARERVLRDFAREPIWEAAYREYLRLLSERGGSVAARAEEEFGAAGLHRLSSVAGKVAKRLMDIAGSLLGLIIFAPILAAIAICIRVTMVSPIIFRQVRSGLRGEPFEMYKFRTMRLQCGKTDASLSDEERLTPIGRFLRSTSLDELPELVNVLKGEMSLVGPRPLLMEYLDLYTEEQARRLEAKPGITGWAQVNGRNALSWEEKFKLDAWYIDNRSASLDLKILLMTLPKVVRREGIGRGTSVVSEKFAAAREDLRAGRRA